MSAVVHLLQSNGSPFCGTWGKHTSVRWHRDASCISCLRLFARERRIESAGCRATADDAERRIAEIGERNRERLSADALRSREAEVTP